MKTMLDIFSRAGHVSSAFKKQGWNICRIDEKFDAELNISPMNVTKKQIIMVLGRNPDFIWASPPCTAFSVAGMGKHWIGGKEKYIPGTELAKSCIKSARRTNEIIRWFPKSKFCIENPRGILRKLGIIDGNLKTITYCQYGDHRMKPTDIWTNLDWTPLPMCKNGDSCHVKSPRGSRSGTQGMKNAYERAKIPHALCREIEKMASDSL